MAVYSTTVWNTHGSLIKPAKFASSQPSNKILDTTDQQRELKAGVEKLLNGRKAKKKHLSTLISWGFRLVEYHKKPEYQAALQASPT